MLVKVIFTNGKIREISGHIANDAQHQKTMGFKILGEETPVAEQPKKSEPQIENPVAEVNEDKDIAAQIETESLVAEVVKKIKKKRGKPKQN